MVPPEPTLQPGLMISPSVRLSRPLGAGGMGSVWLADHLALKTEVVVKFMSEALGADPASRERFAREAIAASQVKSPHVVQTFDHGVTTDGTAFIVMERLEGEDLAHRIEKGSIELPAVASILTQVCRALARAHAVGIVHRDIKPDNIFLCEVGGDEPFVKLLDFGIAKATNNPAPESHTRTGAMMGTPYYMSPEQFAGLKDIDFRTDLWSLGVVAFECVTGARPFEADTLGGLAIAVHSGKMPVPSAIRAGLPAALDAWFLRACAREPAARFQSAKEFAESFARTVAAMRGGGDLLGAAHPAQTAGAPLAASPGVPANAVTGGATALARTAGNAAARSGNSPRTLVALAAVAALAVVGGGALVLSSLRRTHGTANEGIESSPSQAVVAQSAASPIPSPTVVPMAAVPEDASAAAPALSVAPASTNPPSLVQRPPPAALPRTVSSRAPSSPRPPPAPARPPPTSNDPFQPHVF